MTNTRRHTADASAQTVAAPPGPSPRRLGSGAGVGAAAAFVFLLALFAPVEAVDSDPAVALLGAQAVIDHGSLRLDPYADREDLAYDLLNDYRIRQYFDRGLYYPNSLGVSIVSVPAVWVANRFGWHMLDQEAEFATQNVLSALGCAAVFLLLFLLARAYLGGVESLALALAGTLGTTVISTGATALWNTNVAMVFTGLAMLHVVRREARGEGVRLAYMAALLAAAFLMRPSSAFFGIACLVYLLRASNRRAVVSAGAALVLIALLVVLPVDQLWPWMFAHYSPARLRLHTPVGVGLYGVIASPSRGLFVFSPFLAVIGVGTVWYASRLWRDPVARLCAIWICLLTVMAAVVAGKWWGGHSFGPRLLSDVVPAFTVLACLVWREATRSGFRGRRAAAALFWVLAGVGVAIHSGQGLFNQATQQWNRMPNIDDDPSLAFDWRYPQFLATTASLDARLAALDKRGEGRTVDLPVHPLGAPVAFDADDVTFTGWYPIERGWRWSRGPRASIGVRLGDDGIGTTPLYLLELVAGARLRQQVDIEINGTDVGQVDIEGFEATRRLVAVPGALLQPGADNVIDLVISDPGPVGSDERQLGVSFRALQLHRLPPDGLTVSYDDNAFFTDGFSAAENGWRWTDGVRARIDYPVADGRPPGAPAVAGDYMLELLAGANGRQRVEIAVNAIVVGEAVISGFAPTRVVLPIPPSAVTTNGINVVTLTLPDAASAPNDPRQLGLAVVSLTMRVP